MVTSNIKLYIHTIEFYQTSCQKINQSLENAGEAFVKGAIERNEFFEEINKE